MTERNQRGVDSSDSDSISTNQWSFEVSDQYLTFDDIQWLQDDNPTTEEESFVSNQLPYQTNQIAATTHFDQFEGSSTSTFTSKQSYIY